MIEESEKLAIIGILFLLFGFLLLLPFVYNNTPKLFRDSIGSHRFTSGVKRTTRFIGVALIITGLLLQILQLYYN